MRERCRCPSRYRCIRYVVSYPRLSRMTRRNGTTGYLRFCGLEAAACRGAGPLVARRTAATFFFAATGRVFVALVPPAARLAGRALVVARTGFDLGAGAGVAGRGAGISR